MGIGRQPLRAPKEPEGGQAIHILFYDQRAVVILKIHQGKIEMFPK